MYQLILFVHVGICLMLIALVLIQHGKGADMGAAFGSGASQTVFGSQVSGSFLLKITSILAAGFFATSLTLGVLATYSHKKVQILALPSSTTSETKTIIDDSNVGKNVETSKKV